MQGCQQLQFLQNHHDFLSFITPLCPYSKILRSIVNFPSNNFARTISSVLVTCHPHACWNHVSWTCPASSACTHVYCVQYSDSSWWNKSFHLWPNPPTATEVGWTACTLLYPQVQLVPPPFFSCPRQRNLCPWQVCTTTACSECAR